MRLCSAKGTTHPHQSVTAIYMARFGVRVPIRTSIHLFSVEMVVQPE